MRRWSRPSSPGGSPPSKACSRRPFGADPLPLQVVVDGIAEVLDERRRQLEGELRRLTHVPRDPTSSVSFGKRVGDGTTEAVERINTTSAARTIAALLRDAERAQAKLDEGTYGRCDGCGQTIPPERLETIPWTSHCVACSASRPPAG